MKPEPRSASEGGGSGSRGNEGRGKGGEKSFPFPPCGKSKPARGLLGLRGGRYIKNAPSRAAPSAWDGIAAAAKRCAGQSRGAQPGAASLLPASLPPARPPARPPGPSQQQGSRQPAPPAAA